MSGEASSIPAQCRNVFVMVSGSTSSLRPDATRIEIYYTHLLRHSYRENGQVKNETVGNLSHLPEPVIELIPKALQGEI